MFQAPAAVKPAAEPTVRRESMSEEDKIIHMVKQSTQDYDPSKYVQSLHVYVRCFVNAHRSVEVS